MTILQYKFIPVALTLGLLVGVGADMLRRPSRRDAEPFHARVREAAKEIPAEIGEWKKIAEPEVPRAAVALLRPNVLIQRQYARPFPGEPGQKQVVSLLFVHCKDVRDMVGHYPPACYPGAGWQLVEPVNMEWEVDGSAGGGKRILRGREYHFVREHEGAPLHQWVAHLMILPDGRFVRDMSEISAAEADYSRRFYGAAQIQLIFDKTYTDEQRRDVLRQFIGANAGLIDALCSGGKQ